MLRLSWFISLGISLIGIMLIQHLFTFETEEPIQTNYLGYIGIIFIAPFLFVSLFITFQYFFNFIHKTARKITKLASIIISIVIIILLVNETMDYKNEVLHELVNLGQKSVSMLPPLNQHTFQIYFNFYTFMLFHTISATIGMIVGLFKAKRETATD